MVQDSSRNRSLSGKSADYLDLLNSWIPNRWFQISRETGFWIQGRLRREASSGASKCKRATGSRRKQELNNCVFTLSISNRELVSVGKIEDDLQQANLAVEEWRKKCGDLQQEKESLLKKMTEVKKKKGVEIDSLNRELSEYIQRIGDLNKK